MKNKRKLIIWAALLVLIIGAIVYGSYVSNYADVRVETVGKGDIHQYIDVRGKVELNKTDKVYSRLSGIIGDVEIEEGEGVQVGTELARIEVDDLNHALSRARAGYNAAVAALNELKKSIKPEQIKQAEIRLDQAEILYNSAKSDYAFKIEQFDKVYKLYESGAASEQQYKEVKNLAQSSKTVLLNAEKEVSAAQYELQMIREGVSEDAIKAGEANLETARLQVKELESNIGKTGVYSSIEGKVLAKHIEKGMAVAPGTLLYELGNIDSAYIMVDVLVDDTKDILIGQKAVLSGEVIKSNIDNSDSLQESDEGQIVGEIYYIAPKAESSISSLGVEQQRVEMRIKFDNTNLNLKPGYGVDVKIIIKEKQNTLYVPYKAVFKNEGADSVFLIKDEKLVLKGVKTGIENDDYIEILEGLVETDRIVSEPSNIIKPGMKIK